MIIKNISIPYGAIKSYVQLEVHLPADRFQFLMVRLKDVMRSDLFKKYF